MKGNLVQFAFIVAAIVLGGALEDMLPSVGSLGLPMLLSLAVFFAFETRTPIWIMTAVAAGAFEEAVCSLPPGSAIVFFAAIAVAIRFLREPVVWIAVAYPSYQIWLALVADGMGAPGRILLSVPVGAAFLVIALAVLPLLWRKAGADA